MYELQSDKIIWQPVARVDMYDSRQVSLVSALTGLRSPEGAALSYHCRPVDSFEIPGEPLTLSRFNRLSTVLLGGLTGIVNSDRVRLGVVSDADSESKVPSAMYFKNMDTTYPDQNNGVSTFKVTYGPGDANITWDAWSLDIRTSNQAMDDTVLVNGPLKLGDKNGGAWVLSVSFSRVLQGSPVGVSRF